VLLLHIVKNFSSPKSFAKFLKPGGEDYQLTITSREVKNFCAVFLPKFFFNEKLLQGEIRKTDDGRRKVGRRCFRPIKEGFYAPVFLPRFFKVLPRLPAAVKHATDPG